MKKCVDKFTYVHIERTHPSTYIHTYMSTYVKVTCCIVGSFFFGLAAAHFSIAVIITYVFYDSSNKHTLHPHRCLRTLNRLGICPTRFLCFTHHLSLTDIRLINATHLHTYVYGIHICVYAYLVLPCLGDESQINYH